MSNKTKTTAQASSHSQEMSGTPAHDPLFVRSVMVEKIKLPPRDLHANYRQKVESKLREKLEGVCSRYGYIRPGSLQILQIEMGMVEAHTFKGFTTFVVRFRADVCNVVEGTVLQGTVQSENKFGLKCTCGLRNQGKALEEVVEVIIPKQSVSIRSEVDVSNVHIGDTVLIEIIGKKFELRDTKISAVGRIVQTTASAKNRMASEKNAMSGGGEEGESDYEGNSVEEYNSNDDEDGYDDNDDVEIQEEENEEEAEEQEEEEEEEGQSGGSSKAFANKIAKAATSVTIEDGPDFVEGGEIDEFDVDEFDGGEDGVEEDFTFDE